MKTTVTSQPIVERACMLLSPALLATVTHGNEDANAVQGANRSNEICNRRMLFICETNNDGY